MKKYEEAQQDFEDGMSLVDIAKKYDVSVSTVRSWKSRHWGSGVAKKTQRVAKNVAVQKPTETAIDELSDSELTDKQKAFVLEYLRISNATQAYINVYDVPYEIANKTGPRLLVNVGIQNEIKRLRKAKLQELSVGVFDLMEDMVIEARADIGDYVEFGKYDMLNTDIDGDVILDIEDNPEVFRKSWVQFKNKAKVDTRPIKSIKMGKDGPVVELHDRNKARQELLKYLDSIGSGTSEDIVIVDSWGDEDDTND